MKDFISIFTRLFFLLGIYLVCSTSTTHAWFGAGRTPGWELTTNGLAGEIALPIYKFSPDYYYTGNTISISAHGINNGTTNVSSPMYLSISRVIEAPRGINITDGDPDNPGLNEDQLYNYQLNGNDRQSIVAVIPLGNITFPAMGQAVVHGSFTPTLTGYYQFDFIDIDPRSGYVPGHILAAGFFRVLENPEVVDPTPTPTPSISPSPSSSSTSNDSGSVSGASTHNSTECNDQAPEGAPRLLSVTNRGSNSATLSWAKAPGSVSYYLIAYGTESGNYQYGNPNIGDGNITSYTVNNLSGDTTYYFVVRAGNGCKPGPFSNELHIKPRGRIITTPASGFSEGVLGVATEVVEPTPSPSITSGSVIGANDQVPTCKTCLWWPILLVQFILLVINYLAKGIRVTKQKLLLAIVISILAYIVWFILNRSACLSNYCQKFWIFDLLTFSMTTMSVLLAKYLRQATQTIA